MYPKKAIMGVGVLLIFISTILVAAIAAGVLIRTSGAIGQKAVEVEKVSRERLTTGFEYIKISGEANATAGTLENYEVLLRLKAGSSPVDFDEAVVIFDTEASSSTLTLANDTYWGINCTYDNVIEQEEFCIDVLFGNSNSILETEETTYIRFRTNSTNAVAPNDNVELQLIPKVGEITSIDIRIPSIRQTKISLY